MPGAQGARDLALALGSEARRGMRRRARRGYTQRVQRSGGAVQRFAFAALRATNSAVSTAFRKSL